MPIPTYDDVVELPREWGPITVPASFEDENGHMNVRHYFDLCINSLQVVFDRLGIDDEYRASRGQGVFTAEHHVRYYSECHVGDDVSIHSRYVDRSDKIMHAMAFLVNDTTCRLACTLEVVVTHVDMTTRRVTPFDADVAAIIDAERARTDAVGWDAPVCGAMGIRR